MKKIICTTIFCAISTVSSADSEKKIPTFSYVKSEVIVVPLSKMGLPESMIKEREAFLRQQKENGYSDLESKYPKTLLSMGKNGAIDFTNINNPSNTHMKHSPGQVQVAFNFKKVPGINPKDVIGFSARGAYVDSKWTGITEFFNDKNIGTCKYSATNMKLSNGSAKIDNAAVRYDINKKPGDIFVQGSINSGFIYTALWFHNEYSYILECANMNYDKNITNNIIELAKAIDRNNG